MGSDLYLIFSYIITFSRGKIKRKKQLKIQRVTGVMKRDSDFRGLRSRDWGLGEIGQIIRFNKKSMSYIYES